MPVLETVTPYEWAKECREFNISTVPIGADKIPNTKWGDLQERLWDKREEPRFKTATGIAVVCGEFANIECTDFDNHFGNAKECWRRFSTDKNVKFLLDKYPFYIQTTKSGGYHLVYTVDLDDWPKGEKLAHEYTLKDGTKVVDKKGNYKTETLIETRSNKQYFVCWPTPGYKKVSGSLFTLPEILPEERQCLLDKCRELTRIDEQDSPVKSGGSNERGRLPAITDPISYFNWHKAAYAKNLLQENGWKLDHTDTSHKEHWLRPGKGNGHSATFDYNGNNKFYVFSSNGDPFETDTHYSPFNILTLLRFNGGYHKALRWTISTYFAGQQEERRKDFIRVQDDYFEVFEEPRRFGTRTVVQARKKEELRQDFSNDFIKDIPKYKKFITKPDNVNYQREYGDFYNLYSPFSHQPVQGSTQYTELFVKHIFGDQYKLGLEYIKVLYERPTQILPILVLVSRQRNTGKSTFFNWLSMIFGENMVTLDPNDLANQYNHLYATKNILAVDETIIDKTHTVERIKRISTQKEMTVNPKYVNQYTIDFYGKIILATNSETNFMKVDQEEIRFWVRKIEKPKEIMANMEERLRVEIPAFLHLLKERKFIYQNPVTRMHFPIDVLANDQLRTVKEESYTWLYKDLGEHFEEYFYNNPGDITVTPKDIKMEYYNNDNRVPISWIRKILKEDYKLKPCKAMRYQPSFGSTGLNKVLGKPFIIPRNSFIIIEDADRFEDAEVCNICNT